MAGKSSFMEKNEFQGEKNRVSGFLAKSSFPRNAQKISLREDLSTLNHLSAYFYV